MKEKTVISRRKFNGRLIKVDVLRVALGKGLYARREIVRHPGAVAVLGRLPDGRFAFVRQFRKPVESDLLEIVAGTREPGENPADCARREVTEETGYKVRTLERLGYIYTAPGFCDERIDIYFARLGRSGARPCPDPDEKIQLVCLPADRVKAAFSSGKIRDAKSLAAWMLFKIRRHGKI